MTFLMQFFLSCIHTNKHTYLISCTIADGFFLYLEPLPLDTVVIVSLLQVHLLFLPLTRGCLDLTSFWNVLVWFSVHFVNFINVRTQPIVTNSSPKHGRLWVPVQRQVVGYFPGVSFVDAKIPRRIFMLHLHQHRCLYMPIAVV